MQYSRQWHALWENLQQVEQMGKEVVSVLEKVGEPQSPGMAACAYNPNGQEKEKASLGYRRLFSHQSEMLL